MTANNTVLRKIIDEQSSNVYPLAAVVPGVTINLTILATGATPTASASVATDGKMTLNIGLPQLNNITSLSVSEDGVLTIVTTDGQTTTYDGIETAIDNAEDAADRANEAAALIENFDKTGFTVVNGKVCQTYLKEV